MTTYSTVNCAEEHNTRKENFDTEQGISASVVLRCAYTDRFALVDDVIGNSRPWPHGGFSKPPQARSAAISYTPEHYVEDGQSMVYGQALVTINYTTKILDLISESLEPTTEFTRLDFRHFTWGDNVGTDLLEGEAPGRIRRGMNLVRTFHGVTVIPVSILDLPGLCNDAPYVSTLLGLTFDTETLLFQPPKIDRVIKTSGTIGFSLVLKMSHNPEGWNRYWRGSTQAYDSIWTKADDDADPPVVAAEYKSYSPGDFSDWLY